MAPSSEEHASDVPDEHPLPAIAAAFLVIFNDRKGLVVNELKAEQTLR